MLEMTVDYVSPQELTNAMLESGAKKAKLSICDMLVRGMLAGAFLGMAATLSTPPRSPPATRWSAP